jgi:hypothetical protein
MIKIIQGENVGVFMVSEESIKLTINGQDIMINVDELNELRNVAAQIWDANNLWHFTKEAKADRQRHELEFNSRLANGSMPNPTTLSASKY